MQDKGRFPDDVKKGYMFDETLNEIFKRAQETEEKRRKK